MGPKCLRSLPCRRPYPPGPDGGRQRRIPPPPPAVSLLWSPSLWRPHCACAAAAASASTPRRSFPSATTPSCRLTGRWTPPELLPQPTSLSLSGNSTPSSRCQPTLESASSFTKASTSPTTFAPRRHFPSHLTDCWDSTSKAACLPTRNSTRGREVQPSSWPGPYLT